ncbi:MAG: hypothetical protein K2P93_02910 [Alphaproteobacteria bacterium]|nr:hypothetical protein [Alphaproteobacteria bacterium]
MLISHWKKISFLMCTAVVLTNCGPKKKEELPSTPPKMEAPTVQPQTALPAPAKPTETKEASLIPPKPEDTLTPQQREKLIIEEEELEPFPG